jgi:Peptidase family M1 domain
LPGDALCCYSAVVKVGARIVCLLALAAGLFVLGSAPARPTPVPTEPGPRDLYQALNALRVDSTRVYYVRDLNIRRDAARISLVEGKLAFLAAYNGRLTGAVFTGHGHVLALPRDPIEKRSLAHFLGAPLLDRGFTSAYIRFTDHTDEELLEQLREVKAQPADEATFAEGWNQTVANLNPWHSLRILTDWLAEEPHPYFYAGLLGDVSGPFDLLLDARRSEPALLGQARWVRGLRYYDVWTSFRPATAPHPLAAPCAPVRYMIETTIQADLTLQGTTNLTLQVVRGGERVIPLELSRWLSVQSAEDGERNALVFFQNEAVNRHEIAERGNDSLLVVLPAPARTGQEIRLRISYRGSVISDAGNGVYFVGDRGSWYAHVGGADQFAPFELTFRWPRPLELVATGKKLEESEEGESRIGRWRSEVPLPVAGFNLGEYAKETVDAGDVKIDLYANHQLEQAILQRLRRLQIPPMSPPSARGRIVYLPPVSLPEVPPGPAAVLHQLALEIADATHFFERYNGPFPYERLAVSQIPGTFGQGWPGLVYLPTFSFLSSSTQQRLGLSTRAQEQFTDVVPYHEVAHQWWGNLVGWPDYRDQWIQEGLANYIALLYADTKKSPEHTLPLWLERYRKELTAKEGDDPADEAGPLTLGYRLRSSKTPDGFERVVYGKGTWVFHMLRSMLRDPAARNPDARFAQLLRSVLETRRYHGLTNADLERAVEAVMTPAMDLEGGHSMDWFFDQWVRSSGIPHYALKFTVRPQGNRFLVHGTLKQTGVPETFLAAVPLFAARTGGKPVPLGTVVTSGEETPFHFSSPVRPKGLLIDPQMTLLCVTQ